MSASSNQIVAFLESRYWLDSNYPTIDDLIDFSELNKEQLQMKLPGVNLVLTDARGLPPFIIPEQNQLKANHQVFDVPDEEFVLAVNTLLNVLDKRSTAAKLKEEGITTAKFTAMKKKSVNRKYWEKRVKDTFGEANETAQLALVKNIENGDLQSIKHFHEVTGIYRPNQEILLNLGILIAQLMEILSRNVDQETLDIVAGEFEKVIQISETQVKELENA